MNILKRYVLYAFVAFLFLTTLATSFAQESTFQKSVKTPTERYYRAKVEKILEQGEKEVFNTMNFFQVIQVKIVNGDEKGKIVSVENGGITKITSYQKLAVGEDIVILKTALPNGNTNYLILDRYRSRTVVYIVLGFFLLVAAIAGRKGLGAIVGLIVSLCVIFFFIVPRILAGNDPLLISIGGSLFIMIITMYLAHGLSKKITVAVLSTFISLILTGILAVLFVTISKLSGLGTEESGFMVQFGPENINVAGLLLGGIIIGALGVLDDVTTTQSATVFELAKTNPKLTPRELFQKGFIVGKEHITSVVNTLVLAYAGASLSLFLLFVLNPSKQPYWVILNGEMITEEIIRTISGSIGLVLAVPITTLIAVWACAKRLI